jgi:ATP-dependent DNA helicase RecG
MLRPPSAVSKTPVGRLGEKLGEKVGEKLGETLAGIVQSMLDNPKVTLTRMVESLGISTTAVEKNIAFLKSQGYIRRVGPAKGGHWEVLK